MRSGRALWWTILASVVLSVLLLAGLSLLTGGADQGGEPPEIPAGSVLLFRHTATDLSQADADPTARGGCDQQRNLSAEGVAQAERIGAHLVDLPVTAVYASPFCRTVDTAEAFGVGRVVVADQLLSTTAGLDASAQQSIVDSGIALIAGELGGDDAVVMVTHTQNIEAITGETVDEGDAVVLVPPGTGDRDVPGAPIAVDRVVRSQDW